MWVFVFLTALSLDHALHYLITGGEGCVSLTFF